MTPDKTDLRILQRIADDGPTFLKRWQQERRACDLRMAGYLDGEMAVYSYRAGGSTEFRTRYAITDKGRAALTPSEGQPR